jgi:hypothetical protein
MAESSEAERKFLTSLAAKGVPDGYEWLSAPENDTWLFTFGPDSPWLLHVWNADAVYSIGSRGVVELDHPEKFTIPGFRQFIQRQVRFDLGTQ